MANQKYNITQKVNLNGAHKTCSFQVDLEPAQVTSLLALMEGGASITKVDDTLTDLTHADTMVLDVNFVSRISMSAKTSSGEYVTKTIKPFKGVMIFKNTASIDDIKAVFSTATPFPLAPTVKPSTVSISTFDTVASG